jgi:hypothetical protein
MSAKFASPRAAPACRRRRRAPVHAFVPAASDAPLHRRVGRRAVQPAN